MDEWSRLWQSGAVSVALVGSGHGDSLPCRRECPREITLQWPEGVQDVVRTGVSRRAHIAPVPISWCPFLGGCGQTNRGTTGVTKTIHGPFTQDLTTPMIFVLWHRAAVPFRLWHGLLADSRATGITTNGLSVARVLSWGMLTQGRLGSHLPPMSYTDPVGESWACRRCHVKNITVCATISEKKGIIHRKDIRNGHRNRYCFGTAAHGHICSMRTCPQGRLRRPPLLRVSPRSSSLTYWTVSRLHKPREQMGFWLRLEIVSTRRPPQ
jgi:hypothetical protein